MFENVRNHSPLQLRYQTALYWAEKAVTVSNGQVEDVYLLAKCMHFCTQYHRAANLITSLKLDQVCRVECRV